MQEYQYDNNQSSESFSFQANKVNTTGTPAAASSSQPAYSETSEFNVGDSFKKIIGSGLVAISGVLAACLLFVSIASIAKSGEPDIPEINDTSYDELIYQMEERHNIYEELDMYFDEGLYDEMYDAYQTYYFDDSLYNYEKIGFLYCMDDYESANLYYEEYVNRDRDVSYHLSAFLYYNFQFVLTPGYYYYENLSPAEKEIIDEKIEEVKLKLEKELGMTEEELYNFIYTFKEEDSRYVDYSAISEYARSFYGEE